MLRDIDQLRHGPVWESHEVNIKVGAEMCKQYFIGRDIVQIVRELIGDPELEEDMVYAPQKHWSSEDRKVQVYSEMWTARWWWRQQVSILQHNIMYTNVPMTR
jgi:hypothetical protein